MRSEKNYSKDLKGILKTLAICSSLWKLAPILGLSNVVTSAKEKYELSSILLQTLRKASS
jgi:hypothetical protein